MTDALLTLEKFDVSTDSHTLQQAPENIFKNRFFTKKNSLKGQYRTKGDADAFFMPCFMGCAVCGCAIVGGKTTVK